MSGSTSSAPKWAAPAWTTTVALAIRCASHMAWLTGEKLSTAPCQSRTGIADRGRVEAPGQVEGQHIVDPAVRRGAQGLGVGLQQLGADAGVGHHPAVRIGHLRVQAGQQAGRIGPDRFGGGLGFGGQPCRSRWRGRDVLGDVGLRHAVVPVQADRALRGQADQDGGPGQAIGHQGRAGQGVRATARAADDGELVQAVGVGDGQDVGGGVGDPASFEAGRTSRSRGGRR